MAVQCAGAVHIRLQAAMISATNALSKTHQALVSTFARAYTSVPQLHVLVCVCTSAQACVKARYEAPAKDEASAHVEPQAYAYLPWVVLHTMDLSAVAISLSMSCCVITVQLAKVASLCRMAAQAASLCAC